MGELTQQQLRKMQLLELDMVKELDRVCRKHNIFYSIDGGTLLGAVRHKGFIPWDDDMDIVMLREEYEKFKKVASEMNPDICFFQDHSTDNDYLWGFGKLRRTGTTFIRVGQEHLKFKTGIGVDVMPLDDVPKTLIGQMGLDFYCFVLRKILWSEVGKKTKKGLLRVWYSILNTIPVEWVYGKVDKISQKSRNDSPNRVRLLLYTATGKLFKRNPLRIRYSMPKRWFTDLCDYEFEGCHFLGTRDYDECLFYQYGDYMTLPPEDKRESHIPFSYINFGDEELGEKK